jgi:hypothetical protein
MQYEVTTDITRLQIALSYKLRASYFYSNSIATVLISPELVGPALFFSQQLPPILA